MFLEMNYKSNELNKQTQINILLPDANGENASPCKTLWLLRGAIAGEHFQELFFANCKDEKIAEYIKNLL